MNNINNPENKALFYLYRIVPAVFFLVWFFIPVVMLPLNLVSLGEEARLLVPFSLPITSSEIFYSPIFSHIYWVVYLIPVCAIFLIVSCFFKKISNKAWGKSLVPLTYIRSKVGFSLFL